MAKAQAVRKGAQGPAAGMHSQRRADTTVRDIASRMARTHGIAIVSLIALGTAAWFLVCTPQDDAPPLPETPIHEGPATPPPPADLAGGRTRVERPAANETRDPAPAAQEPPPPSVDAAAPTNVILVVRDRNSHEALDPFAWRFVGQGVEARRGEGQRGQAELSLPAVAGTLLVESPGHRPETVELTPPAAVDPARRIELFLASRAPATGVSLTLRGDQGTPVSRVRIDLWRLAPDAASVANGEDPRGEPLWKRQFEDVEGLFVLEELAAGRYALRAQPVDGDGFAESLQPARFQFEFFGHEAVPLRADLQLGQVLRLLQDGDTTTPRQVSIAVHGANDEIRSVLFRSVDADGKVATGFDVARVPGRVESVVALPPQELRLEVFLGEQSLPVRRAGAAIGVDAFVVTLPR